MHSYAEKTRTASASGLGRRGGETGARVARMRNDASQTCSMPPLPELQAERKAGQRQQATHVARRPAVAKWRSHLATSRAHRLPGVILETGQSMAVTPGQRQRCAQQPATEECRCPHPTWRLAVEPRPGLRTREKACAHLPGAVCVYERKAHDWREPGLRRLQCENVVAAARHRIRSPPRHRSASATACAGSWRAGPLTEASTPQDCDVHRAGLATPVFPLERL